MTAPAPLSAPPERAVKPAPISPRALGRLLSRIENNDAEAVLGSMPGGGHAHLIGITGPPGAGKSTLVDKLIATIRAQELTVAVLAVDPSSPFSGGAILGDRVRMNRHSADPGVFIRSMAARTALGGLAAATRDAVSVLDAVGFSVVLVETVGVGQSELDVVRTVDTVLVLVAPGLGDTIQTLKAGVLEIADLLVVNMADREGAKKTVLDLRGMLSLSSTVAPPNGLHWQIPILETVATDGRGVDSLWRSAQEHLAFLQQSGDLERRREQRITQQVTELLVERTRTMLQKALVSDGTMRATLQDTHSGRLNPHAAAERILARWCHQVGRLDAELQTEQETAHGPR